jgi:glycosyltransferase involved in cell wall biosynthesis
MISLRMMVPLLPAGKPIVVKHGSWLRRNDGRVGIENYCKLAILPFVHNVTTSKAFADSLPVQSTIIPNPFDSDHFLANYKYQKDRDIVFLGRLVLEKGCHLLIHALFQLKLSGFCPTLTIVGDGPERASLELLACQLQIRSQVEFAGEITDSRFQVLGRHRVMAIPSLWAEPFGIVALEGIASGCAIVASEAGGLPYAVGPCGLFFPNGDVEKLASTLMRVLTTPGLSENLVAKGPEHLAMHHPIYIANKYLALFNDVISHRKHKG